MFNMFYKDYVEVFRENSRIRGTCPGGNKLRQRGHASPGCCEAGVLRPIPPFPLILLLSILFCRTYLYYRRSRRWLTGGR